uniref:Subtilisin-like protease SBT3.5 n=1 Tax=Ananas comosus var. bracteatus TaxID=296719 RepID=A0A6V7QUR5_ANACO
MLTDSQAEELAELPEVITVKPNRIYRAHTTRSWDFLGLDYNQPTGLLQKAKYGEDVVIGVVDSCVWPESKSFDDSGYGPIPSRWRGKCEEGEAFGANNCSRKIIGARYYTGGVSQADLKGDFMSPRDFGNHGTHTASTAAGGLIYNASFHNLATGNARGGAPRARLAIYKACWGRRIACGGAALLAAIDDAINDGVDILSLSLGGPEEIPGTLHAVAKGITVVFSAGNDGPAPQTIKNSVPWVITVAASTIDRSFPTVITLGSNQRLVGQSIFYEIQQNSNFTGLVDGYSCDADSLNGTNISGEIVLCYAPDLAASTLPRQSLPSAVSNVISAGGGGLIFAQYTVNILENLYQCQGIPCVLVDFEIANKIANYMSTTSNPVVKVSPTSNVIGMEVLAPKIAAFSSRGPSVAFPGVLKPDVAAPGVSILAARRNSYFFDSGTSMACPHVSAVAALLKSLHPDWSPAAIKSAIVTTASVRDGYGIPIEAEGTSRKLADPFDFGGGHINPNRAADPGLLNLPSIAIADLKTTVTISRTVTSVGPANGVYKAVVEPPAGVQVVVEPSTLAFDGKAKIQSFKVTFTATRRVQGDYTFGSLVWSDGADHSVRIPIAVRTVIEEFYADTS